MAETRSGHQYLKKYDEAVASSSKRPKNQPSNPRSNPWRSRKSFGMPRLFQKIRQKDHQHLTSLISWLNWPTSPTKITLYELLRLSKSTKEALKEALAYSEAFIALIPAGLEQEDEGHCF